MTKVIEVRESRRDEPPVFARVAIAGFGLIGASIALAVKRRWPATLVVAVDRKPVIEAAMREYMADVGGDSLVMAADVDLLILSAPVRENIRLLRELPEYLQPSTLVTDVSSTKRRIVEAAEAVSSLAFVGGHPIAGAAASGLRAARADLFDGHPWILTPRAHHPESLQRLESFIAGLGAVTRIMTPELHDRFAGAVSHLPQITASALMHVVGHLAGDAGLEIAGAGLRDTTRLAASPPDIWRDIAATNEDVLREALDQLVFTLSQIRDSLTDGGKIEEIFVSAAKWRNALAATGAAESDVDATDR